MSYTMKLVDFETETTIENFGTCELCMSTGELRREFFVFEVSDLEDEDTKRITVENGEWDYGDYDRILYLDNSADFAHWISKQTFEGKAPKRDYEVQSLLHKVAVAGEYEHFIRGERYRDRGFNVRDISVSIVVTPSENRDMIEDSSLADLLEDLVLESGVKEDPMSYSGMNSDVNFYKVEPYDRYSGGSGYRHRTALYIYSRSFVAENRDPIETLAKNMFDYTKMMMETEAQFQSRNGCRYDADASIYFTEDEIEYKIEIPKEAIYQYNKDGEYPDLTPRKGEKYQIY